jgi:hypothetical protein
MLKSDVDRLIESWLLADRYIFKTYNWFSLDYIVIERISDDKFECHKNSTSNMGSFNKSEMIRLIGANIFIHLPFEHWNQDFRLLRSGGCECGAARTNNPDKHAFRCPKYRK